jgi:cysteinyl-tRNA synthetase
VRREFRDMLQESMQKFVEALENDIDSVIALTSVFDFITTVNRDIDNNSLTEKELASTIEVLKSWDMVMGVMDWSILENSIIPENIITLAQARVEAKKNKDYVHADEIRKEVE